MIDIRPATWADVTAVAAAPSRQTQAEIDLMGWTRQHMLDRLKRFLLTGHADCIAIDGRPEAIIAVAENDGHWFTWFFATDAFYVAGAPTVLAGRRHMAALVRRHGRIASLITSQHPNVGRWMRLLGATLVDEEPITKVYVFA